MTRERWARVRSIFEGALEQPVEARTEWVRQACQGDEPLVREVWGLLRSHATAGDFLEQPAHLDFDLDILEGGTELGAFRIIREIGRGGMGVVYLAHDQELGRNVALKALPSALSASPELRQRLRREARAAANIKHPSIATVHALSEIDGQLFIVSEFVQGTTLRELIGGGPLEASRAYAVAVKIASALSAAHAAGVIHRDLKPENVIVTPDGEVKVVDFGIAYIEMPPAPDLERLIGSSRFTRDGVVLGTPGYMSPEQQLGQRVDARTDVYSFGILFGEMLLGRRPETAADRGLIPARFAELITRCVSLDPDARFRSGSELLKALADDSPKNTDRGPATSPRWWWEFHQAVAALVYGAMVWPAWIGREIIGGSIGRALFFAVLIAVSIAATLRLHLWFMSRFSPGDLAWSRQRVGAWVFLADWLFVLSLAITGLLVGEERSPIAAVLIAVAAGAAVAFLVIERGTARAAFAGPEPRN